MLQALPTVVKEVRSYPTGTLHRGQSHTNNKKDKNSIVLFLAAKRTKKCKLVLNHTSCIINILTILYKNIVLLLLWVTKRSGVWGKAPDIKT